MVLLPPKWRLTERNLVVCATFFFGQNQVVSLIGIMIVSKMVSIFPRIYQSIPHPLFHSSTCGQVGSSSL